mmetsp:Transcript_28647/g.54850  ORF Transcript_28647/g.54850 Transcript_28647/m.54850 type:complete len:239 (-) Transcript_28647:2217-2933(-)
MFAVEEACNEAAVLLSALQGRMEMETRQDGDVGGETRNVTSAASLPLVPTASVASTRSCNRTRAACSGTTSRVTSSGGSGGAGEVAVAMLAMYSVGDLGLPILTRRAGTGGTSGISGMVGMKESAAGEGVRAARAPCGCCGASCTSGGVLAGAIQSSLRRTDSSPRSSASGSGSANIVASSCAENMSLGTLRTLLSNCVRLSHCPAAPSTTDIRSASNEISASIERAASGYTRHSSRT